MPVSSRPLRGPLVLGSGSPRRKEILQQLRIPFVVVAAAADESTREGEEAGAYLERVVLAKLAAVRTRLTGDAPDAAPRLVLVADTSVIVEGEILGKPRDPDDATSMIARLAGRRHEVRTRFALGLDRAHEAPLHSETVVTAVTFRPLERREIDAYVASGEGVDKAGAYAVQGLGAALVARIDGSYTGVVGLPACEVGLALERVGFLA